MDGKNRKVIFVSSGLSLPRVIKRVKSFQDGGYSVEIYGFDRGEFQDMNAYPPGVKVHHLGGLPDGEGYFHNLKEHYKKFLPIFKKYKNEDIYYYAIGFVPAFLVKFFSNKSYVYEISDLVYGTFRNGFLKSIFSFVDRIIIRGSYLTVLTSQGFLDYLFPNNAPANTVIQPNKLSCTFKSIPRNRQEVGDNIKFGFIGYIRYPNTIFRFASVIGEKYPQYEFHFYGDSKYRDGALALADKYSNVYYHGRYKNPEDLVTIYNSVDVIMACYDAATFNERVAEPNKLYEALYFSKPIIATPNTFLAKRVDELRCGYMLDATSEEQIVYFLNSLTSDSVNQIAKSEFELDDSVMIDNPQDILNRVKNI